MKRNRSQSREKLDHVLREIRTIAIPPEEEDKVLARVKSSLQIKASSATSEFAAKTRIDRKVEEQQSTERQGTQVHTLRKYSKPLRERFSTWRLVAGTSIAVMILLLANTAAFSLRLSRLPYTVESEIISYADSPSVTGCGFCSLYPAYPGPTRVLMTSYNEAGTEVVLSWSAPDQRLFAAVWAARLAIARAIDKVGRSVPLAPELESPDSYAVVYTAPAQTLTLGVRDELANSGCRPPRRGEIIGQDVILDYPTVVARYGSAGSRTLIWMAPVLSCFALQVRVEAEQQDGSWKLVREKKAMTVTINR